MFLILQDCDFRCGVADAGSSNFVPVSYRPVLMIAID